MSKKTAILTIYSKNNIILQVKANHKFLLDTVDSYAQNHQNILDEFQTIDKAHGRIEIRKTQTFAIQVPGWRQVTMGCKVIRDITHKCNNKFVETQSCSYYVCTQYLTAEAIHLFIRNHWSIESSNHYIKDTVLFEDANRIRIKPENMMVLRSFGYNIIQANRGSKCFSAQMESNKLNMNNLLNAKGVHS